MPIRPTRRTRALLPLVVLVLAAALPFAGASAQNLVTNPGFEGAVLTGGVPFGYTVTATEDGGAAFVSRSSPHTGLASFIFEDVEPANATLSQTLATTVGASYLVSFFARNIFADNPANLLTVRFGGVQLFSAPILNLGYAQFAVTGVASSTSTALQFTGFNTPGITHLDDLSVTEIVSTPEPSTWALCGTGLAAVAGITRRRQRRRTA